jgi:hypothetical protein
MRCCTIWAAWAEDNPVLAAGVVAPLCSCASNSSNWAIWFWIIVNWVWVDVDELLDDRLVDAVAEVPLVEVEVVEVFPGQVCACARAGITANRQPTPIANSRGEPGRLRITDSLIGTEGTAQFISREQSAGTTDLK